MKKKSNETTNNSPSNSKELIKRTNVDNTPFTVIKPLNEKAFITVGKYRIPEPVFEKTEDAITYINEKPWLLIGTLASIVAVETTKQTNNN